MTSKTLSSPTVAQRWRSASAGGPLLVLAITAVPMGVGAILLTRDVMLEDVR
jgi:hypothetical protein